MSTYISWCGTLEMMAAPNRYRKLWKDDGSNRISAQSGALRLMQAEFPDKPSPIGVVICPMTWQPALAWALAEPKGLDWNRKAP